MLIRTSDRIFTIDDKYIEYSPFLHTVSDTGVAVDMDEDAVIIDSDSYVVEQYINFLQGKEFTMDEDVAIFFDFMGHSNKMEYPLDYWKIKLQDNWIRDNFYKLGLVDDPYYGLVEVPIVVNLPRLDDLPPNVYVAGGAALYMTGELMSYSDIDFFTTNIKDASEWILSLGEVDAGAKVVMVRESNYQLIKRLYRSPSEIVHGFDLDCVGVIWDGEKLWATRRAMWSIKNRTNWFDPERMSPSYVHRLGKYMFRGYNARVPLVDELAPLASAMNVLLDHTQTGSGRAEPPIMIKDINDRHMMVHAINVNNAFSYRVKMTTYKRRLKQQDILMLMVWYGVFVGDMDYTSDYEYSYDAFTIDDVDELIDSEWRKIDPMTQLTGTFSPTPVDQFMEWITESMLVA